MEQIISSLIMDTPLPKLAKIRQKFDPQRIENPGETLMRQLARPEIRGQVKPGMRVAVGVGSRGIAELPRLVRVLVKGLKDMGALPFIVPAMGSHGGATPEGQVDILRNLGVSEESAGCPVVSSMEVVELGGIRVEELGREVPVYIDKNAYEADGIVALARVKPHTGFRAPCESGMSKMLTIGLGKQKGANVCHRYTYKYMGRFIEEMAAMKIEKAAVLFAVGVVENAYDQLSEIQAVLPGEIIERDKEMLIRARSRMARFLFDRMDVVIVMRMGKNVSGDGMDPNITGRWLTDFADGGPKIGKLAVLDLTEETHGNAVGVGAADLICRRIYEKMDMAASYANALTTTGCNLVKLPMMMDTDCEVVKAAISTSNAPDFEKVKMAVILDTMHMNEIYISEGLEAEARNMDEVEFLSGFDPVNFGEDGSLRLEF